MACFNCYKNKGKKLMKLTFKLQGKKKAKGFNKPDIDIIRGLQILSDDDISYETLVRYSAKFMCQGCVVYLRKAVNKKFELDHHIEMLNEIINQVTNEERHKYYKENYGVDKEGRCWSCMYQFVAADYQKKHSRRFNMRTAVYEEMRVGEAVRMLMEEQADTLTGLYDKKTFICHGCLTLLKNVIKTQCMFETLHSTFTSLTDTRSMFARLQAGEKVPIMEDKTDDKMDNRFIVIDRSVTEASNSTSVTSLDCAGDATQNIVREISVTKCITYENPGKRKHSEIEEDDSEPEFVTPKLHIDSDTNNDTSTVLDGVSNSERTKKTQIKLNLLGREVTGASIVDHTATNQNAEFETMSDQWKIYYYTKFAGRAEFIRLVFEEAGVPYTESTEDFIELRRLIIDGEMSGYPHFAPPVVTKGNFQLSQTPVICRYLGEQFGLYPDTVEDRIHAEQINQCCHDYIAEGRLAFHGKAPVGSYASQKEETQPYIDRFVSERIPRWLKFFERVLAANNQGKGFLYGNKICYTDLALFHVIHATEAQFPDAYTNADYIPLIKLYKNRIASRPNIARYLKSDRWRGFCGDSMM